MTQWIDHPLALALASALLHFVWQGALLAFLALAFWRVLRTSASGRYIVGVATLAVMLAAPLVTTAYLANRDSPLRVTSQATMTPAPSSAESRRLALSSDNSADAFGERTAEGGRRLSLLTSGRPVILPLWLAGVLVLSGRLLGGWMVARRLTRRFVSPVKPEISALAARVAHRLALDRAVRIVESQVVSVPLMVGWLKPVVLLPAAVLTSLTPAQVEALLAHELAHIRRHDYLVNLLQSVVETLLFYHPAVWWISRQVRTERERCCDDLAVMVCDRVTYVTALTDLAALGAGPRIALAATDGSLLHRVRRLLDHAHADRPALGGWMPALLLVLSATAFLPAALASSFEGHQFSNRVDGGVPGGVQGVVPTGVPDGVAGGVPGGVGGGVREGVSGGVPAGVPGGVPNVASGALPESIRIAQASAKARKPDPAPSPAPAAEARQAELLKLLAQEQETAQHYLQQQGEIEQRRLELELKAVQAGLDAARTEQEIEIRNLRRELKRVQEQIEVGLGHPEERERLVNALHVAEARLNATRSERNSRLHRAMLEIEAAKQKLQFDKRQLEIEHARRLLEVEKALGANRMASAPQGELENTVLADQTQPIVAGDILAIEIAGEPALPRTYAVAADGTITLPLLGSQQAAGRTADQVRDEIRRLLNELRLKEDPAVIVTRRQKR